jgi:hypothetical protein
MEEEVTTAEAAEILGVGARHVLWYHAQGLLSGRRIGLRMLVFRREDVLAFEKPKRTGRPVKQAAVKPPAVKKRKPGKPKRKAVGK